MKIYSKITGELLHETGNLNESTALRVDVAPNAAFLQVASLNLPVGMTFKPHRHHEHLKITQKTQESWFVYAGIIKAIYYDLDNSILCEQELGPGMFSITYNGGHNYECIENALVMEYKTGPYYGQEFDKTIIQ